MKFETDAMCSSCDGTGLYIGMGERDGAAVVCHTCEGTGRERISITYTPFTKRKGRRDVLRVFQTNPGVCIGGGAGKKYQLSDFGGQSYQDWKSGTPFPIGSENRSFTCPAWWYQSADYSKKPDWKECIGCGSTFYECKHFSAKEKCWERWDKEFGRDQK